MATSRFGRRSSRESSKVNKTYFLKISTKDWWRNCWNNLTRNLLMRSSFLRGIVSINYSPRNPIWLLRIVETHLIRVLRWIVRSIFERKNLLRFEREKSRRRRQLLLVTILRKSMNDIHSLWLQNQSINIIDIKHFFYVFFSSSFIVRFGAQSVSLLRLSF